MTTLLYTHAACIDHNPGEGHPERPDRLRAIMTGLEGDEFNNLERREAPQAEIETIALVHDRAYIDLVLSNAPKEDRIHLDPDTVMSPDSLEAALRATGSGCASVDAVLSGEADNSFCAVRPPGHHAEGNRAMGFCLFNSVAIAAEHARSKHGLKRVAVVDFDVHHGNGTQHTFEDRPGLMYCSTHQSPFYPGTGDTSETGCDNNIVNVPMARGAGTVEFRRAFNEVILPALKVFEPELLIISAGFDAHEGDILGELNVTTDDYSWVTRKLMDIADECCQGRIVSMLEGGYDLRSLQQATLAHIRVLMGNNAP